MKFSWDGFDSTFLKEIIKASAIEDKELYLESDDAEALAGCVSTICNYPDQYFIRKYRRIIERYWIFLYFKHFCYEQTSLLDVTLYADGQHNAYA